MRVRRSIYILLLLFVASMGTTFVVVLCLFVCCFCFPEVNYPVCPAVNWTFKIQLLLVGPWFGHVWLTGRYNPFANQLTNAMQYPRACLGFLSHLFCLPSSVSLSPARYKLLTCFLSCYCCCCCCCCWRWYVMVVAAIVVGVGI